MLEQPDLIIVSGKMEWKSAMDVFVRDGIHFERAARALRSCRNYRSKPLNDKTAEFCLRQERIGKNRRTIINKLERRIKALENDQSTKRRR